MKIQCYVILLTLTYTATLVLSDTASQNSASDKLSSSSSLILPIDNAQRVERSPKYGMDINSYLIIYPLNDINTCNKYQKIT